MSKPRTCMQIVNAQKIWYNESTDSWLSDSGYIQTHNYEIEVYHLFPKDKKYKRHYEIGIPVKKSIKS